MNAISAMATVTAGRIGTITTTAIVGIVTGVMVAAETNATAAIPANRPKSPRRNTKRRLRPKSLQKAKINSETRKILTSKMDPRSSKSLMRISAKPY